MDAARNTSRHRGWPRWWRRAQIAARRANVISILEVASVVSFLVMSAVTWFTVSSQSNRDQLIPSDLTATLLLGTLLPAMAILVLLGRRLALQRSAELAGGGGMHAPGVLLFDDICGIDPARGHLRLGAVPERCGVLVLRQFARDAGKFEQAGARLLRAEPERHEIHVAGNGRRSARLPERTPSHKRAVCRLLQVPDGQPADHQRIDDPAEAARRFAEPGCLCPRRQSSGRKGFACCRPPARWRGRYRDRRQARQDRGGDTD